MYFIKTYNFNSNESSELWYLITYNGQIMGNKKYGYMGRICRLILIG
jgi:hypothetical protein